MRQIVELSGRHFHPQLVAAFAELRFDPVARGARLIAGTLDVLLVGASEIDEADELREAGLQVEHAGSLVAAMMRLQAGAAALVVAGGELCAGRESDAFAAFRESGARAVIAVYPAALAWRVGGALHRGADDVVALPAPAGEVLARVLRILRGLPASSSGLTPSGTPARARHGDGTGDATDHAVGDGSGLGEDLTAIHRNVNELDRLLELVVEVFARRSTADRCSLMLVDSAHEALHVRKSVGLPDARARPPVPLGKGFSGRVATTGMPLLVTNVALLPRRRSGGERRPVLPHALVPPPPAPRVPRRPRRRLPRRQGLGGSLDHRDLGRLQLLAEQSAQAVENAIAYRQLQELAATS